MKITFQNQTVTDTENRTESIQTEKNTWGRDKIQRNKKSVNANTFGAVYESGQIPMPVGNEENNKGKSLIELQQDAGNTNVALQQDYMTLLSHTMSQEDYAKACEDGFDPRELDQDTAVTIVDRIKAELVRSGQNIAGYTDDIDLDTLAAAVGSDTLAQSIEEQFRATDIPLTPENVDELKTAWELASSLQQPQEGEVGYLVDNGLEPEIWNLYVAENSGAKVQQNTVPQELQDQMDKVITDAGLPVNDENRQKAQWLVGAGLPLTTDTLQQLAELDTIDYPVSEDAFAQAAVTFTSQNFGAGNLKRCTGSGIGTRGGEIPCSCEFGTAGKYIRESHRNGTGLVLGCKMGCHGGESGGQKTTGRDPVAHDSGSECETLTE